MWESLIQANISTHLVSLFFVTWEKGFQGRFQKVAMQLDFSDWTHWFQAFLLIMLTFSTLHNCRDIVEEKCQLVCRFSLECTEKAQNRLLLESEKEMGRIYCIQGCTMIQSDILQCYDDTFPSCDGFQRCILQSGILE